MSLILDLAFSSEGSFCFLVSFFILGVSILKLKMCPYLNKWVSCLLYLHYFKKKYWGTFPLYWHREMWTIVLTEVLEEFELFLDINLKMMIPKEYYEGIFPPYWWPRKVFPFFCIEKSESFRRNGITKLFLIGAWKNGLF